MTSFGWLHLTDLHIGMAQQPGLWPTIKDLFYDDLELLYQKSQPWDLVVFTGDLTQRADAEEFKRLDDFLNELWDKLRTFGSNPSLVAVPGNHDLTRPNAKSAAVKVLGNSWAVDSDVRDEFWTDPNSDYRKTITAAFQNYSDWWERTQFKPAIKPGILPGDFSAVVEKAGASIGIVGLNTSFLQLTATTQQGTLALDPRQFHKVCEDDGPAWLKKHNACLLLTHHPPDWLNEESREHLNADIVGNNNFAVHLFGHMHETRYLSQSIGAAPRIRVFQNTSLFGLEEFGEENKKVSRRHGYCAGRIDLEGDQGTLTFWPRTASKATGQWNLLVDDKIFTKNEQTTPELFPLKGSFQPAPAVVSNDGETPAMAETPTFKKRWAILIGINNYEYFAKLHYCREDVMELAQKLREDLNFEVLAIHDDAEVRPDRDSIRIALNKLRSSNKIEPDDLLLFYFAGHGINEGRKDYLLPITAHPDLVKDLGIPVQVVIDELKKFNCKHTVMFIDACRETVAGARGAATTADDDKAIGVEAETLVKKANIVTFFSCDKGDRSYEIDALQHGSFTYCILEAIREGVVTTVFDLNRYLVLNVPNINTKNDKPVQLPHTVMIPESSNTWPIFRKPSGPSGVYGPYGSLVERLNQLGNDKTFAENILPSTLEFLRRISDNMELKLKEQMKLNAIKALCANEFTIEEFSDTWQAIHRKRINTPQPKRPVLVK
ncbi:MAG TPA: caspase family protein [Pyrinomonadaceae bacterium]|nr:caspase family protein [Pyrinomonadaceae bacterium]